MIKIRYILVVFTDVKMPPSDIPKLRGYFAAKYADIHQFHNHLPGEGYDYHLPLIQYRIIGGSPAMLGIGQGIEIMKQVFFEIDELKISGQSFTSNEKQISLIEADFGQCEEFYDYRFISPWMALNQENHLNYLELNPVEQKQLLKTILARNLKSLSKGFDYWIPEFDKIMVDGWFTPLMVNFHSQKMQCFKGDFTINFRIPDLLGLGKQSARGFGVVSYKMGDNNDS